MLAVFISVCTELVKVQAKNFIQVGQIRRWPPAICPPEVHALCDLFLLGVGGTCDLLLTNRNGSSDCHF
jgi:hypothetical protein